VPKNSQRNGGIECPISRARNENEQAWLLSGPGVTLHEWVGTGASLVPSINEMEMVWAAELMLTAEQTIVSSGDKAGRGAVNSSNACAAGLKPRITVIEPAIVFSVVMKPSAMIEVTASPCAEPLRCTASNIGATGAWAMDQKG